MLVVQKHGLTDKLNEFGQFVLYCIGHCIVTSSDRGMGRLGGGSFILGFGWGGQGVGIFFLFLFCFCAVVNRPFMAGT